MCGIAGVFDPYGPTAAVTTWAGGPTRLAGALGARGPDDAGSWVDPRGRSPCPTGGCRWSGWGPRATSRWPRRTSGGRSSTTGRPTTPRPSGAGLAGEGMTFRGSSDTEVLVAGGLGRGGLAEAVEAVEGMFAFAVWDRRVRPAAPGPGPFGKKPLFYGWVRGGLVFASELKAFRRDPGSPPGWTRAAVGRSSRRLRARGGTRSTGASPSCARGPGSACAWADPGTSAPEAYWSAGRPSGTRPARSLSGSRRASSPTGGGGPLGLGGGPHGGHVPVGALLSGGDRLEPGRRVDAAGHSTRPVRTFTVGFVEPALRRVGRRRRGGPAPGDGPHRGAR